jgi:PAS domain S-box-containing protein
MTYATKSRQIEAFPSEDREIVFTYDLSGRFTFLNETGELILGYSREEACQLTISQLIAPELVGLVLAPSAGKSSEMPGVVYELDLVAKDGRRVELEISTETVSRNGRAIEIQGIALPTVVRRAS